MRPDCQLRAFNAVVTGSPTMVLLPCSHSCPPTLVPLFGDDGEGCGGWHTALSSQGTNSPRTWCSSAISPSSFGPFLVILGRFPPQLGPWAYYPKWAGVPRSFGPTIAPQNPAVRNLGRGVGFWCLLLAFKAFCLLMTRCWRFGTLNVSSLNSDGSMFPTLDSVMAIKRQGFLQPLWARKTGRLPWLEV